MNQQQLTAIKQRAVAAITDIGTALEKAKAAAEFRHHAAADVLALLAEVERLQAMEDIILSNEILRQAVIEALAPNPEKEEGD